MSTTEETRKQLAAACDELKNCVHAFKIQCGMTENNSDPIWRDKVIHITNKFTEIFPNVMAKIAFPDKTSGNKSIIIKAKAGSKLDLHKMIPLRFVYVIEGDQRDETGVIVLNEDEGASILPLVESSMYFMVDTKLIMEIENV